MKQDRTTSVLFFYQDCLFFCRILEVMKNDPWLEKWLDLVQEKSAGGLVLEPSCGHF
jgi:hypothetical protein